LVGVVRDTKIGSLREKASPTVYDSVLQSGYAPYGVTLHVRTRGSPAFLIPRVRAELRAVDERPPVHSVRTLQAAVTETLRRERMMAWLSSFFSLLALVLTGVGVYGIVSYTVERRTHEIGVRIALGARPLAVVGSVTREALIAVLLGIAIGVPAALAASRMVKALLFGLEPDDPVTVLVATAVTLGAAALAAGVAARRAAGLQPMVALRHE
jgi:ABC-type lipoprotein release transport system permease subunit